MTTWIDNRGMEYRAIEIERPRRIVWQNVQGDRITTPYLWPAEYATRPTVNGWPVTITARPTVLRPPIKLNFARKG